MRRIFTLDSLCLALLAAFTGFVVFYPLTNTDIWWHLATAREMVRTGGFLRADPFSFTPHDAQWVNLHWVFQLLAYLTCSLASVKGLLIAKSVLFAVACLIAARSIAGTRPVAALVVFSALMYEVRYLVLARPIIITLLLMALFLWCLERYTATGKRRFLLALLPAQVVWANSQGLFMLGPAIAFAYWAGETLPGLVQSLNYKAQNPRFKTPEVPAPAHRSLIWEFLIQTGLFALIPAANLVNPYGWDGLRLSAKLFGRINPSLSNIYALNVSENLPLRYLLGTEPRYVYAVVLAVIVAGVTFWINRRALRLSHILLSIMFLVLAWMAQRNILLFFFILAPLISVNCAPLFAGRSRAVRIAFAAAAVFVIGVNGKSHARILAISPSHADLSPFRYPTGAVDFLKRNPVPGRIFNSIRAGGYLLWELFPPRKVFIDGRLVLRTPEFFAEYLTILDEPRYFPPVARKFEITHALLPTAIFDRYLPLVKDLYDDPDWKVATADGAWILFVRDSLMTQPALDLGDSAAVEGILTDLRRQWRDDTAIFDENCRYLGNLLVTLGSYDRARQAYAAMGDREALLYRARSFFVQGDLESAADMAAAFLARYPRDVRCRMMLSRISLRRGDYRAALENVILVLRKDPFNREAASILKQVRQQLK